MIYLKKKFFLLFFLIFNFYGYCFVNVYSNNWKKHEIRIQDVIVKYLLKYKIMDTWNKQINMCQVRIEEIIL